MSIQNLIREVIEEQLLVEEASKERFIQKNENLTQQQQKTLLDLLSKKQHLENMIHKRAGGWQNFYKLTWDDLIPIIEYISKSEKKRSVKTRGIKGLKEWKDYVIVKDVEFDPKYNNRDGNELEGVYIPLTYEASKLIASKYIGGVEGEWCISYQKDESYWYKYSYGLGLRNEEEDAPSQFAMFIYKEDPDLTSFTPKFALQHNTEYKPLVWDKKDVSHGESDEVIPGINIKKFIAKNKKLFADVESHMMDEIENQEHSVWYYEHEDKMYEDVIDRIEIGDMFDIDFSYASSFGVDMSFIDRLDEDEFEVEVTDTDIRDLSVTVKFKADQDYEPDEAGDYEEGWLYWADSHYNFTESLEWSNDEIVHFNKSEPNSKVTKLKEGDFVVYKSHYERDVEGVVTDIDDETITVEWSLEDTIAAQSIEL